MDRIKIPPQGEQPPVKITYCKTMYAIGYVPIDMTPIGEDDYGIGVTAKKRFYNPPIKDTSLKRAPPKRKDSRLNRRTVPIVKPTKGKF